MSLTIEPFFNWPDVTISFAAIGDQLVFWHALSSPTGRDHGLNEILDVAQNHTEALHWIRITRFGLHGFDLHALQHRELYRAAAGAEDAPAEN